MAASPIGLRLTPAAESDLEDIWRYTADTWGTGQADAYLDAIADTFARLQEMPQLARERAEFTPPVRVHPSGKHVVIYRAEPTEVLVIRVLGGRQDWMSMLARLD